MTNNIRDIIESNLNGLTFIGLNTETNVKLKGGKKNLLQGRVTKKCYGMAGRIAQDKHTHMYQNAVRKGLTEEGKDPNDYQPSPRSWGVRVKNAPFIEHKGQLYLEINVRSVSRVEVLLDGVVVDPTTIEGYPINKGEGRQGGLSEKVILRDFKIESIKALRINKQEYFDLTY